MKTKQKFFTCGKHLQFRMSCMIAATLLLGVISDSAQSSQYLFTGTKTNVTLNPGLYQITAYGAQGGYYSHGARSYGGGGAEMEGEFNFTNVTTLTLLVGGTGQAADVYLGAGGGGGSFVVNGTTLLVIAGGGGGAADAQAMFSPDGGPGLTGENGGNGYSGVDGSGGSGGSGGAGGAGVGDPAAAGAGGGGYTGNGTNGGGIGGSSYMNGGAGGAGYYLNNYDSHGGYGGGGGCYEGGGGGGGYSGGGGGGALSGGGGGGSYIKSSAIADLTEVSGVGSPDDSPNGEIIITVVHPPLCISESGNTVSVNWPAIPGWSLHQNTNLANPSGWTASSGANTVNGTNYLNITAPTGSLFFRVQEQ